MKVTISNSFGGCICEVKFQKEAEDWYGIGVTIKGMIETTKLKYQHVKSQGKMIVNTFKFLLPEDIIPSFKSKNFSVSYELECVLVYKSTKVPFKVPLEVHNNNLLKFSDSGIRDLIIDIDDPTEFLEAKKIICQMLLEKEEFENDPLNYLKSQTEPDVLGFHNQSVSINSPDVSDTDIIHPTNLIFDNQEDNMKEHEDVVNSQTHSVNIDVENKNVQSDGAIGLNAEPYGDEDIKSAKTNHTEAKNKNPNEDIKENNEDSVKSTEEDTQKIIENCTSKGDINEIINTNKSDKKEKFKADFNLNEKSNVLPHNQSDLEKRDKIEKQLDENENKITKVGSDLIETIVSPSKKLPLSKQVVKEVEDVFNSLDSADHIDKDGLKSNFTQILKKMFKEKCKIENVIAERMDKLQKNCKTPIFSMPNLFETPLVESVLSIVEDDVLLAKAYYSDVCISPMKLKIDFNNNVNTTKVEIWKEERENGILINKEQVFSYSFDSDKCITKLITCKVDGFSLKTTYFEVSYILLIILDNSEVMVPIRMLDPECLVAFTKD